MIAPRLVLELQAIGNKFRKSFLTSTHRVQRRDGGYRGSWWDEYPNKNLKAKRKFINIVTNVEVLKFGLASSLKSYTVTKEVQSSGVATRNIKFIKEGKIQNLNPFQTEQIFGAKLQQELHLMLIGIQTPINLFS
jgi:hypothetical protein